MARNFSIADSIADIFRKNPHISQLEKILRSSEISAADLAEGYFAIHPQFAGGLAKQLRLQGTPSKKTLNIWEKDVKSLFKRERIDDRLIVIGLSLLEPELRLQLDDANAWDPLIKEMAIPLSEILTDKGQELYSSYRSAEEHTVGQILPSYCVKEAISHLPSNEPISAAQLAQEIFKQHSGYAKDRAASVSIADTVERLTAEQWLDRIRTLFDFSAIEQIKESTEAKRIEAVPYREASSHSEKVFEAPKEINDTLNEAPQLHGRLVIIGLCLLDPKLRRQLEMQGVFRDLVEELYEPLDKILTPRGRKLLELPDSVPNWDDNAINDPKKDLLGRAAFADYLFTRIEMIPKDSEAYVMHIYGPWGSGKSTILNFLGQKLENSGKWMVVDYNAWQNQHIDPPWWSLMDSIFQSLKKKKSGQSTTWERLWWKMKLYRWQLKEYLWRLSTRQMDYIIALIVLSLILGIISGILPYDSKKSLSQILTSQASNFENIGKILAVTATLWTIVIAANRSLLLGSSQAARDYVRLTSDPMAKVKEHLQDSIERLSPMRLAILIDDLDRCQSKYVIELLEGILTLFRRANVVIVVAADRRWLNACYEQSYEGLTSRIREPGKPLGSLFLEKAFRFSTPVPGFPEGLKKKLWRHLLQVKPDEIEDMASVREEANKRISAAKSESELIQLTKNEKDQSVLMHREIVEKAVVRLASPEVEERLEHFLVPYSEFLEANPRAMKRLVNSYSANRALDFLSETRIDQHQLALWTIIQSRWPQLAEELEKDPRLINMIGPKDGLKDVSDDLKASFEGLPDELKNLFEDAEVYNVFRGGSFNMPLLKETIAQCAQIHGC